MATLAGAVTGPTSQDATVKWTLVSGPGSADIATPDALSTTVSVSGAGLYLFRLTATVGIWSQYDLVYIQFNGSLMADAGPNQTVNVVLNGTLSGSYAPVEASVLWTKISGPGTVFFDSATSPVTNFSVSSFGTYVLRLTVTLGGISVYDETEVIFDSNISVDAGPDQSIEGLLTASLAGSFTPPSGTVVWTKQSGPGTAMFVDDTSETTDVTVSVEGTYVFRLTVTVPGASAFDEVTIDFLPNPGVALDCSSDAGSAILCGFSEYASPSLPPKKYRRNTALGSNSSSLYADNICTVPAVPASDTCNHNGYIQYNPATCVPTTVGGYTCVSGTFGGVSTDLGASNCFKMVTKTPTQQSAVATNTCCPPGPPFEKQTNFGLVLTLTDEDTELDAMARASLTPGSSCTASIEPRGAGDFVFNFVAVAYDINCSDLVAGHNYIATVDLVEETYGGGSPVTTQVNYPFTASGSTHMISDVIVCPSGKQVTVQNVVIAFA